MTDPTKFPEVEAAMAFANMKLQRLRSERRKRRLRRILVSLAAAVAVFAIASAAFGLASSRGRARDDAVRSQDIDTALSGVNSLLRDAIEAVDALRHAAERADAAGQAAAIALDRIALEAGR